MSGEIHIIHYGNNLMLKMEFVGDRSDIASVKFKWDTVDRGVIEETPFIPVTGLFSMSYLIDMNARRTTMQYEKEVGELVHKLHKKRRTKSVKKD